MPLSMFLCITVHGDARSVDLYTHSAVDPFAGLQTARTIEESGIVLLKNEREVWNGRPKRE